MKIPKEEIDWLCSLERYWELVQEFDESFIITKGTNEILG